MIFVRFALILTIICYANQGLFAEAFIVPAAIVEQDLSDPEPNGDFDELVIPLKRAQNLLLVEARIDTLVGNFILDTGAPYLVLNNIYFRQGKLNEGTLSAGITGSGSVSRTTVEKLEIQNLYYESLNADLVNLGHLEDSKGVKILGLLGASLFTQMEMEIDTRTNMLYLRKLDENGSAISSRRDSALGPDLVVPFKLDNNIIYINGSVAGKKLLFCLDTGAESNVLSNTVSEKVLKKFHLRNRSTLSGTSNQKIEVLSGLLEELVIGDHLFMNMQTAIVGLNSLQWVYNAPISGILGYNFLSQGTVVINFKKKELTMYFYRR